MTKKKYSLTPEHREILATWKDFWIANAMNTTPMDDNDRTIMQEAILEIYAIAKLKAPRVVFAPSPLAASFAAGFAAVLLHKGKKVDFKKLQKTDSSKEATDPNKDWFSYNGDMRALAKSLGIEKEGLKAASESWKMRQGGNQWSGWSSYQSFFKDVAKLDIDWSKWNAYEKASIHGGPRYMHSEFCIVSDRPRILKVDEQNRPHCEDGPFCQWSDGFSLYSWHGTRVPKNWIEKRKELDPSIALTHSNIEQRRAAAEIVGWKRVIEHVDAKVVNTDKDPQIGILLEANLPDAPKSKFLKVLCGTGREFVLPVPQDMKTALQANAWTYGLTEDDFFIEVRT